MAPKTPRAAALALSAALLLAGCMSTGGEVTPAKEPKPTPEAVEATTDSQTATEGRPSFGDTWAYDDGLTVTIGEPEPIEPAEWARFDEDAQAHLKFEVRVENSTGDDYKPNLIVTTASSGGREAQAVYDMSHDLDGSPTTTVLDGGSVTYNIGFSVADPDDVHVEFRDFDFNRPSVIFVN